MKSIAEILAEESKVPAPKYPAPQGAQKEIKKAIERFNELPDDTRRNTVLLYWLLGSGTPEYKMPQDVAEYTNESKGEQKCSNCRFIWVDGNDQDLICSQIKDNISRDGWCKLWVKAEDIKINKR